MTLPITPDKYNIVEDYIASFSRNTTVTASRASRQLQFDAAFTEDVLSALVELNVLQYDFVIRCPKCGLMIESIENVADIENEVYCHNCEGTFEIDSSDVEVTYTLYNFPFLCGQQNDDNFAQVTSAVRPLDSLAHLIETGKIDTCSLYFNPTDAERKELINGYNDIFSHKKTTVDKGNSLVRLTMLLFGICKNFRVTDGLSLASGHTKEPLAQIDCYVLNKLCNPITPMPGEADCFMIECKNESDAPKGEYMKKLHSTLVVTGKRFGVIISKCEAPKTFVSLSNQIFNKSEIIIISMDKHDLQEIVQNNKNLLEMMVRKIEEVKLNATKDLRKLGLYDS